MSAAAAEAAARAARLLARPDAWLEEVGDGWQLRLSPDRRRRPVLRLDPAAGACLVRAHGLSRRRGGGWRLARPEAPDGGPPPGRPGVIPGEREVVEPDGRRARRACNLGESPIAWLARRRDAQGRPWLSPVEAAAGERLREDVERAGLIGRLTMSWDAAPRGSAPRGPGEAPLLRGRAARARAEAALAAAGPGLREVLERVCLAGSALREAERALALPRGGARPLLKLALQRVAAVYRLV